MKAIRNPIYHLILAAIICASVFTYSLASAPSFQGSGGVTASTGLSDSANLARLNTANAFSVAGHSIAMTSNNTGISFTHTGAGTYGYPMTAPGITLRYLNTGSGKGYASLSDGSNDAFIISGESGKMSVNGGYVIGFSQAAGNPEAFMDVAIGRNAAGVLEVDSGTIGGKGFLTFPSTGGIVGTVTNNSVDYGCVGELVQTLVASGAAVSVTNATVNITLISLSTGDWDVMGNVNFIDTGLTDTIQEAGISTTTATVPTDGSEVFSLAKGTTISGTNGITLPRKRVSATSASYATTGLASSDVVTATGSGFSNGDTVYFTAIAGGACTFFHN